VGKRSGLYPRVRVDGAGKGVVSRAGGRSTPRGPWRGSGCGSWLAGRHAPHAGSDGEDKRARARAARRQATGKRSDQPARLVEGQRVMGWREALSEPDAAYPGRLR
jgi:hypothetical protein